MKKVIFDICILIFVLISLNSCEGQTAKAASTVKPKTETVVLTKADSAKIETKTKQEKLYKNLEETSVEIKNQQRKLDSLMRKKR